MSVIVTGGAGFIGSNLIRGLNARGIVDIWVVDNIGSSHKFKNLIGCQFKQYLHKDEFRNLVRENKFEAKVSTIFHQGACSNTMELNGNYMIDNNYQYSIDLLDYAIRNEIHFICASSAAVYGAGTHFKEDRVNEAPLNVYGYSKFLFDEIVRERLHEAKSQIVSLRYFNVYGPRESHKGQMASVSYHLINQMSEGGLLKLFEGSGGYAAGEQRRDFVYVDDVVKVNLEFLDHPDRSGIYNCGTGQSQTFNELAVATINAVRKSHGEGLLTLDEMLDQQIITYRSFPEGLVSSYQ
ncbi:MAG: ADP-glyceromanno-heptose 6-epimerase, partial [Proteobacteria bacterium]|nr:ADP-glyceromanno-heptose 6-epimerase [Pseudomonadota bacterium]